MNAVPGGKVQMESGRKGEREKGRKGETL